MSVSVSIDISFIKNEIYNFSSIDLIDGMLSTNWTISKKGEVCYLPLGDNGLYKWKEERLTTIELKKIIKQKELCKEVIGIIFYWSDTKIGLTMLIFQDYQVSFNININRLKFNEQNINDITDVNWYLERILPCFNSKNIKISTINFNQSW